MRSCGRALGCSAGRLRCRCWVRRAVWQGLECRTQRNSFAAVVAGSHGSFLSRAVSGPKLPSREQELEGARLAPSHPQASRCAPPAARCTASSTARTPRLHGSSPCWSPRSTWCRPSACPATRGSRWAMDSRSSWVGSRGCESALRPRLGPARLAEGGASPPRSRVCEL